MTPLSSGHTRYVHSFCLFITLFTAYPRHFPLPLLISSDDWGLCPPPYLPQALRPLLGTCDSCLFKICTHIYSFLSWLGVSYLYLLSVANFIPVTITLRWRMYYWNLVHWIKKKSEPVYILYMVNSNKMRLVDIVVDISIYNSEQDMECSIAPLRNP